MADQQQIERLQADVSNWNEWREQRPEEVIDLHEANLSDINLSNVNLSEANLRWADLSMTNLTRANLSEADLIGTDLWLTNLSDADLSQTDLSDALLSDTLLTSTNFRFANLSNAHLSGTNFSNAYFSGANFSHANIGGVIFDDLDLRETKGLETIKHDGPSGITTSTLERSKGKIPEVFLRGAGLSDTSITYARLLAQSSIQYHTCFISYSSKNQDFAEQLYTDLQSKGVRCWYAAKDLKPGDFYRDLIDESIKVYDKVLLILSEHSVKSTWVEKEVEQAWKREGEPAEPGEPLVLFPIRLDDTVMQTERAWARQLRYLRHIGDFTGWKDHDAYQEHFQQLLHDLKQERLKSKI